ncbi:unnamed protein product [Discula destructiva]
MEPPLTENEKAILPMLQTFMTKANTRVLEQAVDDNRREAQSLQHALNTLQRRYDEDRTANTQLLQTIAKIQGANEELRSTNDKLSQAIDNLAMANEQILNSNKALVKDVEKLFKANEQFLSKNEAVTKDLEKLSSQIQKVGETTENLDQNLPQQLGKFDARMEKIGMNTKQQLSQLDPRIAIIESRQQNVEEALEHLARKMQYSSPSQESEDIRQDQLSHMVATAHGHNQSRSGIDVPLTYAQDPPSAQEPELDQDDRHNMLKQHYIATKERYKASPPNNQRAFIWQFIEGSGDNEFCTWIQQHLLAAIPSKVTLRKHPRRKSDDRIIALGQSLRWEDVREALRGAPMPF